MLTSPVARIVTVGASHCPVLLLDNAYPNPEQLQAEAGKLHEFEVFQADHYPGVKRHTQVEYSTWLAQLLARLAPFYQCFELPESAKPRVLTSTYSITTTPAEKLRPVQMLPHIDTAEPRIFAAVHYLSDPALSFGGTCFYRHNHTQIERVQRAQLPEYAACVKQEAMRDQRHLSPRYIAATDPRFTLIGTVENRFNRLVIYPANLLHSGDISPIPSHIGCQTVAKSRLTITSLLKG